MIWEFLNKEILRIIFWIYKEERVNLVNWNILVIRGKESKSDFFSSGEWNGISLNFNFRGLWDSVLIKNKC